MTNTQDHSKVARELRSLAGFLVFGAIPSVLWPHDQATAIAFFYLELLLCFVAVYFVRAARRKIAGLQPILASASSAPSGS